MRTFDTYWLMDGVVRQMRREAFRGIFDGRSASIYLARCTADHLASGTRLIFTRDAGAHASGWWKNPDFDKCFHLSLSFRDPLTGQPRPRDVQLSKEWVAAFYHEDRRLVWAEPPYGEEAKRKEIWHYRVFTDEHWQPILPRKEVYTREFTPAGWLSYSDLNFEKEKADASEKGFDPHPAMES